MMRKTTMTTNKRLAMAIGTLALSFFSQFSSATFVGTINASPQGTGTVKSNQVSTTRITWSGSSDSAGSNTPGQPYNVFSSQGQFFVGQNVIATNNRRVSSTLIAGTLNAFTIRESLQIPRSVLAAVEQNNVTLIQYVRTFTDESGGTIPNSTAVATLRVTSSNSGTLSLSQVDLRFNTKNLSKVIKVDEALSAYAEISHGGTGLFQAVWEIATPISTSGTPIFTRLATVRQFLGAGRNIVIESPRLPSNLVGNYTLRLRIISPEDAFEDLELRYSVIPSNAANIVLQTILTTSPLPNSRIDEGTVFSWQGITGANTYQIEIYETKQNNLPNIGSDSISTNEPDTQGHTLSSGVLLPSEKTSSALTKIALKHLQKGKAYQWRIVAINKDGFIIGKSAYQKIQYR